jgi:outer membrane protein assembly factor BamB
VLVDVGSDIVAIDGATATVRFRKPWGRSAGFSLVVGDVLVVTRPGELVAVDPKSGQELWRRPVNGTPTALDGGLGQVLVAIRRPGDRARWTILALDPVSSDELWSREIRDEPVEGLAVGEEGFVVVRRRSILNAAGGTRTVLVLGLHSLLSGEPTKEILLSAEGWTDAGWRLGDPRTIVTTRSEGRTVRLDAVDLGTGLPRWSKLLEGTGRVRHLVPQGDTITAVGFEGRVRVLALATGEVRRECAIAGGVDTLFGTEPILDGDRMYAILRAGGSTVLAAFDLKTGRAAWTLPTAMPVSEGWLRKSGDVLVTIQAPMRQRRGEAPAHQIAVVDARSGDVIHRIDGEGLSGWHPAAAISDGALVIVGEHAFAVYR